MPIPDFQKFFHRIRRQFAGVFPGKLFKHAMDDDSAVGRRRVGVDRLQRFEIQYSPREYGIGVADPGFDLRDRKPSRAVFHRRARRGCGHGRGGPGRIEKLKPSQ